MSRIVICKDKAEALRMLAEIAQNMWDGFQYAILVDEDE